MTRQLSITTFSMLFRLLLAFALFAATANAQTDGPLTVSADGHWFEYRDSGKAFFMAGSGGPEGFFYETDARKQTIVDDLIRTGANALYVHSIRSFEGDGFSYEDPFNTNEDINSGVDNAVLNNWLGYLTQLDNNKIVTWFHIIDDTARPWGCIDNPSDLSQAAKDYVATIVNKFKHLDHLVWLSGEEYLMGSCSKAQDDALMSAIAAEIRKHDSVHPIGVHHNNGQAMQFGSDAVVNVFAQQICGNSSVRNPDGIHGSGSFNDSWVYVMAECHPWHKQLIEASDRAASRVSLRQSNWATAMAGGYVLMYDAYECPNKQCTRNSSGSVILNPDADGDVHVPAHDPSEEMLRDLTRLHEFMTVSDFQLTEPTDSLATGDTDWVMADPSTDTYILYSNASPNTLGVANLFAAGVYNLRWYDPASGAELVQQKAGSESPFSVPAQFGDEVALSIKLDSNSGGNRAPIANNDNYDVLPGDTLNVTASGVLANDTDFENDSLTAQLLSGPINGQLNLNANGSFSYTPNMGFEGVDSFSYRANDGNANSAAATVSINVSDTPAVVLWLIDATSNQRIRLLVNNDIIGLNSLGFSSYSVEAEVAGAGSVVFSYSGISSGSQTEGVAPYAMFGDTNSNFDGMPLSQGALNITATAYQNAGGGGSIIAQTNLSVTFSNSVPNRAPVANADRYTLLQNTSLTIPTNRGVLVNDLDADDDTLSADLVSPVSNGTLDLQSNGGFEYTPSENFVGVDEFSYRANDGELTSSVVRVELKVVDELESADDFCVPIKSRQGAMSVVCF